MPVKQPDPKIDSLITKQMRELKSPYGDIANQIYSVLSKATFTDEQFARLVELFHAPISIINLAIEIKALSKDQYDLLKNLISMHDVQLNAIHDYHQLQIDILEGNAFDKPNSKVSTSKTLIKYADSKNQSITKDFAKLIYDNTVCYLHNYAQPAISLDILNSIITKKLPHTEESVNNIISEIQHRDSVKLKKAIKKEIKQVSPVVDQNNKPIDLNAKTPDSENPFN